MPHLSKPNSGEGEVQRWLALLVFSTYSKCQRDSGEPSLDSDADVNRSRRTHLTRVGALVPKARALRLLAFLLLSCTGCKERAEQSPASTPRANASDRQLLEPVSRSVRGSIVVLGSSTAAGIGPKHPKNAWVARYQAFLAARFPNVTLVNLAVGGQTTFEVQPTGYVPPANRPAPVEGRNITAALRLNPRAVVVNLPSNDQANNYPVSEQLANYDRLADSARSAHVQLWVSTSQPRNFNEAAQIDELKEMRDAILEKFSPHVLDFWTPFASPTGFIKASYNAGDGTHLNDAAHAILANIVEAARIPEHFAAEPAPG